MTNNRAARPARQINETWRPTRGLPQCRKKKVCEYVYRDPSGLVAFTKIRYRWRHVLNCDGTGPCHGRDKEFRYKYTSARGETIWQKPPYGDEYLYHLEEIEPAIDRGTGEPIYWCEGEKDADAIRAAGALATSHHQGAGNATPGQAQCLYHPYRSYNAKRIILVADLDAPGAYDVIQRNNLLVEAGFRGSLEIVRAAAGKDAADHLEAGYSLREFVPVNLARLKASSRQYRARLKENSARYMGKGDEE